MTDTERKLNEANFFLSKLNIDDPYFDYFLSAFLNSSRSVAWIMRHEFSKVNGWENWFELKSSPDEQELLKELNDLRIRSAKKDGVKTPFFLFDHIRVDESSYADVKKLSEQPNGTKFVITVLEEDDYKANNNFKDTDCVIKGEIKLGGGKASSINRKNLVVLCEKYYHSLEKLVSECICKFVQI